MKIRDAIDAVLFGFLFGSGIVLSILIAFKFSRWM